MSWEEFISYVLANSTKVDKIAVFDYRGRPLAITDDIETCDSEGFALTKCMLDSTQAVTRLCIDNDVFQCFHGINQTLVGTKMKDKSCMMVAKQAGQELILFIGYPDGQESFIEQMKDGLARKAAGTLTVEMEEPGPLIPLPASPAPATRIGTPNVSMTGSPRSVATDDVLVHIPS